MFCKLHLVESVCILHFPGEALPPIVITRKVFSIFFAAERLEHQMLSMYPYYIFNPRHQSLRFCILEHPSLVRIRIPSSQIHVLGVGHEVAFSLLFPSPLPEAWDPSSCFCGPGSTRLHQELHKVQHPSIWCQPVTGNFGGPSPLLPTPSSFGASATPGTFFPSTGDATWPPCLSI